MHTVLKVAQLMWTGHVIKMPDEQLPKKTTGGKALSRWPEETAATKKTPSKPH